MKYRLYLFQHCICRSLKYRLYLFQHCICRSLRYRLYLFQHCICRSLKYRLYLVQRCICLFVWLVGFLSSSSTTMLYHGRVPRLTSDNCTCCHTRDRAGCTCRYLKYRYLINMYIFYIQTLSFSTWCVVCRLELDKLTIFSIAIFSTIMNFYAMSDIFCTIVTRYLDAIEAACFHNFNRSKVFLYCPSHVFLYNRTQTFLVRS